MHTTYYSNPTPKNTPLEWQPVDPAANIRNGDINYITLTASPRSHQKLSSNTATVWVDELPNYTNEAVLMSLLSNYASLTYIFLLEISVSSMF